ncbi:unnamed protein product [Anisakis simplex]|uniref:G_PROTEIN_RECEP_F1_2 domain-containing protein n=1 Tax=Anisakis simplex TaxID=6269 RepID=A0A0M3K1J0_ANISI|nr:unnamed protein product [Anisakis simplex]
MGYTLNGPVTAVFVVCGVVLNSITVLVLLKQPKRCTTTTTTTSSTSRTLIKQKALTRSNDSVRLRSYITNSRPLIYTYLLWITFSDTSLLLNAFLMYCMPTFMSSLGFYARLFPTYYMLSNASLTSSVWLICALMFERYRALCRPLSKQLKQRQQITVNRAHKILTLVLFIAVLFSLPRLFELSVFEYDGELYVKQTVLVNNRLYMIGYRIIGGLLFYSLFPYIGLFTMSTRISFALHQAAKERQRLASATVLSASSQRLLSSAQKTAESELILLAVMAKFLLSRLMPTALDVAEHVISAKEFLNSDTATICVDISNLLVVISSATNFFIYFSFSRSFRHAVCPPFVTAASSLSWCYCCCCCFCRQKSVVSLSSNQPNRPNNATNSFRSELKMLSHNPNTSLLATRASSSGVIANNNSNNNCDSNCSSTIHPITLSTRNDLIVPPAKTEMLI